MRLLIIAAIATLAACGSKKEPAPTKAPPPAKAAETTPTSAPTPEPKPEPAPAAQPPKKENPLMDPAKLTETAPETYKVKFDTTKGEFVVQVTRAWAPNGADRFYNLVKAGYYNDIAFFRVIDGFMAQFGIHGDPQVNGVWRTAEIKDDPVKESNTRGRITFATRGPNTRTVQLFINYGNNARLDQMGFAPFGEVVSGMEIVDSLHNGYGEGPPRGRGPNQGRLQSEGNAYLKKEFAKLDWLKSAEIMP